MLTRFIVVVIALALCVPGVADAQTANDSVIVRQQIGFDTTPPTIPDNVVVDPVAPTQIDVSWDASYDFYGMSGYEVWRDGTALATVTAPTTAYSDTGLTPETLYAYTVRAFDLTGNYSGFSTSTSTTTPAVPITPTPTTTPDTTGPLQGTFIGFSSFQITAEAYDTRIELSLSALSPFIASIRWGATEDGEEGALSLETYRRSHQTTLVGLRPNTTYTITAVVEDGRGHRASRTIVVTTTAGFDAEGPANPRDFRGTPLPNGIRLSWQNPYENDFKEVRIMRQEGTLPVDPYDGVLIYEGAREGFLDAKVTPGVYYGYAIFAKDVSGNFSSGAITFVRAYQDDSIGDAGIITVPEVGTTSDEFAPQITIEQNGEEVRLIDGVFTLSNNLPFTISVPADAFPKVLKTIVVTLTHPDDRTRSFSFLLRTNSARDKYQARIAALSDAGRYTATMSVLDLDSKTILSDEFVIESIYEGEIEIGDSPLTKLLARALLIALLGVILAFAIRRLWHKGIHDGQR